MAKKPQAEDDFVEPTEQEAEGIRMLIQLALQLQETYQQMDPEGYARVVAEAQGQEQPE